MKKHFYLSFILLLLLPPWLMAQRDRDIGGGCEDCDLMFANMPASLSWETQISAKDEPGEPLEITGTLFKPDGRTPAAGVILYVYHTDVKGEYTPSPNQKDGRRHGHLRGWMKTDAQGRYKFTTIRPASYPQGRNPQHIHPIIDEPGKGYYWVDEYLFDDDPYLTENERSRQPGRGGKNGIIHLTKDASGTWKGKRDIILGKNVPGYK
jgi:protocatechuate 3,4-dioxygenase, beta subunit